MDVSAFSAPPPGSAQAGDLYVDLQSRTLWLGVDPAVDPSGFVLISDIVAQQAEDADIRLDTKAYTDQAIPAYAAPKVHTHTSSQITDFSAAVTTVVGSIPGFSWVRGMILQYSGSLAEVGVGQLAGWAVCNGANGTPDLRDRFVIGAGNKPVGTKNAATSFSPVASGAHVHTINATAITEQQMPSHNHGGSTGYVSHNHQHYVTGGTDAQGVHNHDIFGPWRPANNPGMSHDSSNEGDAGVHQTTRTHDSANAGSHGHNFAAWSGGISENHYHAIPVAGSDQGHTHTIVGGGGVHTHLIQAAELRETLPYYALAFIMKL
jgi:hypothetical protein